MLTELSSEKWRNDVLWKVNLNNGTSVYQQDSGDYSSWLELKKYLDKNRNLYVKQFYFCFRDNHIEVANEQDVFFSHKVLAHAGSDFQQHSYLGGKCNRFGGSIFIRHFIVPELVETESEGRSFYSDTVRGGLIVKPEFIDSFEDGYYDREI